MLTQEETQKILNSKALITSANKYTVKCTSVNPHIKGQTTHIANFNIMSGYHFDQAQEAYDKGDYQAACNFGFSASLRDSDYKPGKGETVDVEISEVVTKSGEVGLFVTSVIAREAIKTIAKVKFNFGEVVVDSLESAETETGDLAG